MRRLDGFLVIDRRHVVLIAAALASSACRPVLGDRSTGSAGSTGNDGIVTAATDHEDDRDDDPSYDLEELDCGTSLGDVDCDVMPTGGTRIEGETPLGPFTASVAWIGTRSGVCTLFGWLVFPVDPEGSAIDGDRLPIPHLSVEVWASGLSSTSTMGVHDAEVILSRDGEKVRAGGELVIDFADVDNECYPSLFARLGGTLEVVAEGWDLSGRFEAVSCSRFGFSVPCE